MASDVTLLSRPTTRISLLVGLRLPTAPELSATGEELNLDAQLGTGAFVPSAGFEYTGRFVCARPGLRAEVYLPLDGRFDVTPAKALLWSAGSSFQVHTRFSVRLAADGRTEGQDEYEFGSDPNLGGTIVFASTELRTQLSESIALGAAVRVPVVTALRGAQQEGVIGTVGLCFQHMRAHPAPAPPVFALLR
jgi:hypothetical protein